jgi:hypothetical protein
MGHATPAILLLIVFFMAPVLFCIRRARRGAQPYIRRIAGIDAIDETIGRSVELGRPLSFTTGLTRVSPLLYACLGVLRYVARKAAIYGSRIFVPCSDPEALVLIDATMQSAYRAERKSAQYNPGSIRFLSEEQFAFASGYQGLIHRENAGGAFLFGQFAAESLILAEAGQQIGAMQIAATTSSEQVPFFLTTCDYTLIGDELYAAGAYLSKDPVQTGSLRGQDYVKCLILALILLGVLQASFSAASGARYAQGSETPIARLINAQWEDLLSTKEESGAKSLDPRNGEGTGQ